MNEHASEQAAENLEVPEHLEYSTEHVWVDRTVSPALVGITEYAADQFGDLVFVDLPEVETDVRAGDEVVELESAKAVQPLVCPVAGTVRYVNRDAADDPEIINRDPYGEGWMLKIDLDDDQPELLTAEEYAAVVRNS
ncbi:glycine cleavage system protein H [Bifidobacterium aemilianum]|uniref:Glycine cleavage system H protein n=1 Tax=Bifidobacterium aemilianum TaxID=2493120 RepID=A0A366K8A6_9BIFI|nr:glycine cleavage system protein GcvH [Bifidobacterium aemilianum]RBP97482.1 glycine cleavage system protein H [Bifidobacterium aemilianum]